MSIVLITAGGTSEPIDRVRSITNTGTGRLGSFIADSFADRSSVERIFYICAENSIRPRSERVTIITVKTVADLQSAVADILSEYRIDAIIHSMAVSDYTVKAVSSVEEIANYLQSTPTASVDLKSSILEAMEETDITANAGKISSQIKSPLILLEQTPKILPMFRKCLPNAVIVGFKLLSETTENILFDTAFRLLQKNGCNFVLANDASQINGDQHIGYLLDSQKDFLIFHTKQEIAEGIVCAVLKEIDKQT